MLGCVWNVMAHAQKPDLVFWRNGRVHLNQRGSQFSRLLAAEVCASAVVMLDTPCSEVVWEYWLPTAFSSFPYHASSCAITFQLDCTWTVEPSRDILVSWTVWKIDRMSSWINQKDILCVPQIIPVERTILCITLLAAFLIFNIVNYFAQSPDKQRKTKSTINVNTNKLEVINLISVFDPTTDFSYLRLQWTRTTMTLLDFKLSPCSKCCMLSSG